MNKTFFLKLKILFFILLFARFSVAFAQKVQLTWKSSNSQNITEYSIYKKNFQEVDFNLIKKVNYPDTTYIDENVCWDSRLCYAVASVNIYDEESELSNFVDILIPALHYELLEFNGFERESSIVLQWSGTGTSCLFGFELQRSKDDSLNFEGLNFIPVDLTRLSDQVEFIDENVTQGKYYYRLKILKLNGEEKISHNVEVNFGKVSGFFLRQNYPNPFNSSTKIPYGLTVNSHVELKIFNANGQEVCTIVDEYQIKGNYDLIVEGEYLSKMKLTSGLYYYRIKVGNQFDTQKMVFYK